MGKEKVNIYSFIVENKIKSALLFILIGIATVAFVYFILSLFTSLDSFIIFSIAIFIVMAQSLFSYYYGDKVVLHITNAKPIDKLRKKQVKNIIDELKIASGLKKKPKLYIIESEMINAFATGRNEENAKIVITTGALKYLNRAELEAVIAHEIGHIKHIDILLMTIATVLVGLVSIISELFLRGFFRAKRKDRNAGLLVLIGLLLAIIAPIALKLIQLAISRKREYLADMYSALITKNPEALANALSKIALQQKYGISMKVPKATENLFIASPFSSLRVLFSTHPPIEERIKILRSL